MGRCGLSSEVLGRDCWPVRRFGCWLTWLGGWPTDFVLLTTRWFWDGDWSGEGDRDLNLSEGSLRFVQCGGLLCISQEIDKSFSPSTTEVRVVLPLMIRRGKAV